MAIIPQDPRKDRVIEILSIVTSAAPSLGGPVSAILNGFVTRRKFERMASAIEQLAGEIEDVESGAAEVYVASEDFEDLLDDTLRRIASERNEVKRRLLAHFLAVNIREVNSSYDELERMLRALDQLQPDHAVVMNALDEPPKYDGAMTGSPIQTLRSRIPAFADAHIKDLVQQLNDMRLIDLRSISTMMTGRGAQELQSTFTPFGRKLLKYMKEER